VSALVLIGSAVRGAPELVPDPPEVRRLEAAIDAAEAAGDLDEVNRIEAHVWLDGHRAPEGRVAGPVRDLFLAMNGIELAAPDPGEEAELPSAWDRLGEVEAPALVVIGDLDLPDVVACSEALAARLPRAELLPLSGTAHLPHLEPHPDCLPAVTAFLATHR
jgi:pimeloyl-ACP methyl ester carboxylesterase